jgi:[lysine-biosynthesis-protein LysW]--L-2-aminoadipate ligase
MTARAELALLASRVRSDERRIMAALERRGVRYQQVDTRALHGGSGSQRWLVALNREIGSVRARYAAWMLEAEGSRVLNTAHASEVCADKWRTSVALRAAGLPTPRAVLALTPEAALDALEDLGYPAVLKPLVGSWGRLVTKLETRDQAVTALEYVAALTGPQAHLGYLQALVPSTGRDIRVIVIGGVAVGASYRSSDRWRTNVARGGQASRCPLSAELAKLAVSAAEAVGAELAGVDIIEDAEGRQLLLEVNSGVEFAGLQQAHGDSLDVAGHIADYTMAAMGRC